MAAGFALLMLVWTYPLAWRLSTHLPGPHLGDNVQFLWNFWWMRHAVAAGRDFFVSPYQMAPAGADLTLHTHTALPAFLGATLLGRFPIAAAVNLTTLASLTLNGVCAYLLAWRVTRHRLAAILAGVIFSTSPYIAAHLNGHFNLIGAWGIPLFALTFIEAVRGRAAFAFLAGAVAAATAYVDYYYVVYQLALAPCVLLLEARQWSWRMRAAFPRWLIATVLIALLLDALLVGLVLATGGFQVHLGSVRISARETFNLRQIGGVLAVAAAFLYWRPAVSIGSSPAWRATAWRHVTVAAVTFIVLTAPILWHATLITLRGGYVTQQYVWRNAPVGIDLLTMIVPSPYHAVIGEWVRAIYARFDIDAVESGAWLGLVPLALTVAAWRTWRTDPSVRYWTVIGALFFVWALGSHIHVAGENTGFITPAALLRYVPVVSNARMPSRAMVVVYLAVGVLAALAISRIAVTQRAAIAWMALALVLADFVVTPFPTVPLTCPQIYTTLRERPESGALVELPLGLADGFGDLSPLDRRTLMCQTVHERPIVGGMLSRLPPDVLARYRADPLISQWLLLSGASQRAVPPAAAPAPAVAARAMATDGIAFVMLNRTTASPALRLFVERDLPLTPIADDGERTLYVRRTSP